MKFLCSTGLWRSLDSLLCQGLVNFVADAKKIWRVPLIARLPPAMSRILGIEPLGHQLIRQFGVGTTAGLFHDLAHKEPQQFGFAIAILL